VPISDDGSTVRLIPPAVRETVAVTPLLTIDPQYLFPGTYNFSVYRGDSYEWWFTLMAFDADLGTIVPVDITGWRFKAEIRAAPDAPLMASLQEMARDDAAGQIAMRLIHHQSRLLTSSGVWDLEAIMPDGWVRTCLRGTVTLVTDVSTGMVDFQMEYPNAKTR